MISGDIGGHSIIFLARHGHGHTIPPHRINYRANLWALNSMKVDYIIAVAAVGGITSDCSPKQIVIPDQIIDYTYGRDHTYFEENFRSDNHVDFTYPYDEALRRALLQGAKQAGVDAKDGGTYGATQGPRLETAAEIAKLERDGCDIVGMTGMPETVLARELGIKYASCAVVANWAAGKTGEVSMADIEDNLVAGMKKVRDVLEEALPIIRNN